MTLKRRNRYLEIDKDIEIVESKVIKLIRAYVFDILVMIRVKWKAISFVMRQWCFPHIGMFSFLHRECINLQESRLRDKMHLHSIFKG